MANIMIIDDDVEHADNLKVVLEGAGHKITALDDTTGAVEKLLAAKPDLVVLDVMFPENPAGGFDLARQIRRTKEMAQLPVILLTAVNQEFPMDFSSEDIDPDWMPVQEFLEKPVDFSDLLRKVDGLLTK